jgi:D-alanyl-D-alanine carboxypeptidase (penicillin-binding protein 5/6)
LIAGQRGSVDTSAFAIRLAAGAKIPLLARMRFPRFFSGLLTLSLALALSATTVTAAAKKKPTESSTASYHGFIVMDAATGKVLLEDHADAVSPPASMVKLMTFAVLQDKIRSGALTLTTPVTVNADDARIGGTQVWLADKEVFPVEELFYAMMVISANDAAHALGRTAAGSVEAFVELMNAKARELGMTQTIFRTPHGLPPSDREITESDLSSPRDYAILCRYLLQNTDILKYTSVRNRNFGEGKRIPGKVIAMKNHNNLLGKVAGVDGLKTGYTKGAGYCLSATAQRNGRRVIVVIMGSYGPKGHEIDIGHARDIKTIELLEKGFSALPPGGPAFVGPAPASRSAVANTASASGAQSSILPATSASPIISAPLITEPKAAAPAHAAGEPAISITVPTGKK